jgi:hypothetical protein
VVGGWDEINARWVTVCAFVEADLITLLRASPVRGGTRTGDQAPTAARLVCTCDEKPCVGDTSRPAARRGAVI